MLMYKKISPVKYDNILKQTLKSHNFKITPQRIAIYNELMKFKEHPTVTIVFKKVHKAFPNISYDTVHRTLLKFAELKLISVVEGSSQGRKFDTNLGRHHHFICVKCNKIVDFYSKELDNLKMPEDIKSKFEISGYRVVIEGVCNNCIKKADKKINI